jgi:hypothetical protein
MTRQHWLTRAAFLLRADLYPIAPVPPFLTVIYGVPSRYRGTTMEYILAGCCSHKPPLIHITPKLRDPVEILGTLVHELIHASVGPGHGHSMVFEKPAREIGLAGDLDATKPGPDLIPRLTEIYSKLGTYPEN